MDLDYTPMFDILITSNSLCMTFDEWFNDEYKQVIGGNKIFTFIRTKYPYTHERVVYSIVMACIMYIASRGMIKPDSMDESVLYNV